MNQRLIFVTLTAAIVALIDAVTKAWALDLPPEGLSLLPVLDLRLEFNRGISFGLFSEAGGPAARIALIAFPGVLAGGVTVWALLTADPVDRIGFALISGGAIGNLIDRIPDGQVTDFIDAYANGWHFPTFNLADVAITAGAALLLVGTVRWPARRVQT